MQMKNRFKKASPPDAPGNPKAPAVAGQKDSKKSFNKSIKAEKRYQPKVVMKGG